MIQKKAQEYCSLRHFIISYTVKSAWSLERNLTFNQGTRKGCGTLRGLEEGGKGIGTGVRSSGKILATAPDVSDEITGKLQNCSFMSN